MNRGSFVPQWTRLCVNWTRGRSGSGRVHCGGRVGAPLAVAGLLFCFLLWMWYYYPLFCCCCCFLLVSLSLSVLFCFSFFRFVVVVLGIGTVLASSLDFFRLFSTYLSIFLIVIMLFPLFYLSIAFNFSISCLFSLFSLNNNNKKKNGYVSASDVNQVLFWWMWMNASRWLFFFLIIIHIHIYIVGVTRLSITFRSLIFPFFLYRDWKRIRKNGFGSRVCFGCEPSFVLMDVNERLSAFSVARLIIPSQSSYFFFFIVISFISCISY